MFNKTVMQGFDHARLVAKTLKHYSSIYPYPHSICLAVSWTLGFDAMQARVHAPDPWLGLYAIKDFKF